MIYDIVPDNDLILSQTAERFDFNNPPIDPTELFENLKETLILRGAVGLSAPQVGLPYQVFVIGNPQDYDSIFSVFNPKIVDMSENTVIIEEGCLTYPGLFIKIKRPYEIRARFSGHDGVIDTMELTGYTARVFQHEYDHLHGITMVQRASKLQLDRAKKQKQKLDRIRNKVKKINV